MGMVVGWGEGRRGAAGWARRGSGGGDGRWRIVFVLVVVVVVVVSSFACVDWSCEIRRASSRGAEWVWSTQHPESKCGGTKGRNSITACRLWVWEWIYGSVLVYCLDMRQKKPSQTVHSKETRQDKTKNVQRFRWHCFGRQETTTCTRIFIDVRMHAK